MVIIITLSQILASINNPKLLHPKSFAAQDNGTINEGVKVKAPDDGHEEYVQDHVEQDSPQREDTKDDVIAVRHTT